MKPGPLSALPPLFAGPPIPWERDGHSFGVEIGAAGDKDAPLIVFGSTEIEARDRAREVLGALAARRRGFA